MDLSKLSDQDLIALDGKDYASLSDDALLALDELTTTPKTSWSRSKEGKKDTNQLITELGESPLTGATLPFGIAETVGQMVTGIPAFVTNVGGRLYGAGKSALEGEYNPEVSAEYGNKVTPELFKDIMYDPKLKTGQLASRALSSAFETTGRSAGAAVQAAMEGSGTSGARELVKDKTAVGPSLSMLALDTAMAGSMARGFFKKSVKEKKQETNDSFLESLREQERNKPVQEGKEIGDQLDLDLGQPNKFGTRPSDFVLDENGIPIRREASLETQLTERGNDLFSEENVGKEQLSRNIGEWKEPEVPTAANRDYLKQQEIEQAYLDKAKQDATPIEEPVTEPTQLGLGGVGRKGFGQGGAIDPTVFSDAVNKLRKYVSEDLLNKLHQPDYTGRTKVMLMPIDYFLKSAVEGTHSEKTMGVRDWFGKEKMKDLPRLALTKEGNENIQWGHEGRHRARAMKEAGLEYMPVEVRSDVPFKDLPKDYITERGWSQEFPIPKEEIDLPNAGVFSKESTPSINRWNGRSPFGDGEPSLMPTLGGTGKKGFGQGGSVGFGFSDYAVDKVKNLPSAIKDRYSKNKAMAKMLGETLLDRLTTDRTPWEQAKQDPAIVTSLDGSPVSARTQFDAGGRMNALKSPSVFRSWVVEQIKGGMEASRSYIEHHMDNQNTGLMPKIYRMSKDDLANLWAKMQMITGKKIDYKTLNWKDSERSIVDSYFKLTDDIFNRINEELQTRGYKKIAKYNNYIPSIFNGNFRISVKGVGKKGEEVNIGLLGTKTKWEAQKAKEWIEAWVKEVDPEMKLSIGEVEYKPRYQKTRQKASLGEDMIGLNEVLDIIGKEDPLMEKFYQDWQSRQSKMAMDHLQFRQHFKFKKGVFGAEGNKGWKDSYSNAKDGFEAFQSYVEASSQWVEMAKTQRELSQAFKEKMETNPNDVAYGNLYLDAQLGRNRRVGALEGLVDWIGKKTGVGGNQVAKLPSEVKKFMIQNVLGFSLSFNLSQAIQVPQRLSDITSFIKDTTGLHMNIMENWNKTTAMHILGKEKTTSFKYFEKFADDRGLAHPEIMEQSALKSDSLAGNLYEKYSYISGKTISAAEVVTRRNFFLTVAESFVDAGMPKEKAALASEKLTSAFFVDYARGDRAMIFDQFGPIVGDLASSLTTFKINDLNQKALYIKGRNWTPLGKALMVQFALGGLVGMYGMDEVDALWRLAFRGGMVETPSVKSALLEAPELVAFGPTSTVTGWDLGSKFSTANTLPGNVEESLFPLASKIGFTVEALSKVFKTPNEAHAALLAWELSPTVGKALIEEIMFKEGGHTLNPRNPGLSKGERTASGVAARLAGTRSLEERVVNDQGYESSSITKALNAKKQGLTERINSEFYSGNNPSELIQEYSKVGNPEQTINNLTKFKTNQVIDPATREKIKISGSEDEQKAAKYKKFLFKKEK